MDEGDASGASGSRARDHLANERTYLAWLRTSLAVVALGAVMARVAESTSLAVTAAACGTVAFGVVALAYGTARYYRVAADLEAGRFRPAGRGPFVIAVILAVALAVAVPLLLFNT